MSTSNVVPIRQTGPRTPAGKRRSSLNALKGGLYASSIVIRGLESEAEYQQFARAIVADLGVRGPLEMAAAERLVSALWRERRIRRYEAAQLSEDADRAAAEREKASELRGSAKQVLEQREAIYDLCYGKGKVDFDRLDLAVEGFSVTFADDESGLRAFKDRAGDILYGRTRRPALRKAVADFCLGHLPPAFREEDQQSTFCGVSVALARLAARLEDLAVKADRAAQRGEIDALLPSWELDRQLTGAESRVARQVSAALADFRAIRAMRDGSDEQSALMPARAQR